MTEGLKKANCDARVVRLARCVKRNMHLVVASASLQNDPETVVSHTMEDPLGGTSKVKIRVKPLKLDGKGERIPACHVARTYKYESGVSP